jgi:hypothetical protein
MPENHHFLDGSTPLDEIFIFPMMAGRVTLQLKAKSEPWCSHTPKKSSHFVI